MDHTENSTTQVFGDCTATVVCDSACTGIRIVSVECVYPRSIHSEVLRHRVFSNGASSSRATPVTTILKDANYVPRYWTLNQPGMVGKDGATEEQVKAAQTIWNNVRAYACGRAQVLADLGFHKQHINRMLEPFSYIRHLITATDWDNFFTLRLAPDADPVIQDLARAVKEAMTSSAPESNFIHLPYVSSEDLKSLMHLGFGPGYDTAQKVSAARCARVSYMKHNGKKPTVEEDLALFERLEKSGHWSPMEHTAKFTNSDMRFANFQGWQSLRNYLGH